MLFRPNFIDKRYLEKRPYWLIVLLCIKKRITKIMNLKKGVGLIIAPKSKETRAVNTNPNKIYKI